uniref:tetraacyldisaccharide 4'-kinase n=1 Tax=Kalanchoe fedtschenkoi TaxID=63787 RepID=A0A7N0TXY4_KALFE
MEKLKTAINQIAYAPNVSSLPPLHRSIIPLLSLASSIYRIALNFRYKLYYYGLFKRRRLPVPVISVGNLTYGGNGKTPMVELLALLFAHSGIPPLILTRGYAGGDEAKMLRRHLGGTSAKIGVGANRAVTANAFIKKFGFMDLDKRARFACLGAEQKQLHNFDSDRIGVAVLDDGMQHLSLWRDLDIVMVNAMMPWGNSHLIPLGPLREPLSALKRADIAVIHHADMVSEQDVKNLELMLHAMKDTLHIFSTEMVPSHYFEVGNFSCSLPLEVVNNATVLCVSAIGCATSFVQAIEKMGPQFVDCLDFSDHHIFHDQDVYVIKSKLEEMRKSGSCPVVAITEKDYDRDPEVLKMLDPYKVLVLCSRLQILPRKGNDMGSFTTLLERLVSENKSSCGHNKPNFCGSRF